MKVIWRGCGAVFLLIVFFIISSAVTPSHGQERKTRTVTQTQIQTAIKRFKTSGSLSPEAKLKQILDCLKLLLPSRACFKESLRAVVTNEILLRLQMREMGEECTSSGKYRKPFDEANLGVRAEYLRLQEELLDTEFTFCNPFKHLSCSPQKKCECGPGTVLKPEANPDVCTLLVGGSCLQGRPLFLFDPFNSDRIDFSTDIPPLRCSEGVGRDCSFFTYSRSKFCASDSIVAKESKLLEYFIDLSDLSPPLSFGEPCNLEHHKEYLKTPGTEWADLTTQFKKLEEIKEAKTQFCDLRRLFFCGNISRKCECMKPAFYDESQKNCTYKHPDVFCVIEEIFTKLRDSLSRVPSFDVFQGSISTHDRVCKGGCIRYVLQGDNGKRQLVDVCSICSNRTLIGRDCNKTLTSFLATFPNLRLPTDVSDFGEQIDILDELNDQATELEKSFVLEKGSPCDMEVDLEGARAVRRIRNLETIGTVHVTTKGYYRDTTLFIQNLIRKLNGRGLCTFPWRVMEDGRVGIPSPGRGLVCGPNATDSKCYEPSNDEYLEVLRKRLIPFETIKIGQPCPLGLNQLYGISRQQFGRGTAGYYTFLIVTMETHYVNQTQFCDSKAFLECKLPEKFFVTHIGKCGFSEEMMRNMTSGNETEKKNSGDLGANAPHFIHISCLIILFTLYSVLI